MRPARSHDPRRYPCCPPPARPAARPRPRRGPGRSVCPRRRRCSRPATSRARCAPTARRLRATRATRRSARTSARRSRRSAATQEAIARVPRGARRGARQRARSARTSRSPTTSRPTSRGRPRSWRRCTRPSRRTCARRCCSPTAVCSWASTNGSRRSCGRSRRPHADDRTLQYLLGMALVRGGKPAEGQQRIEKLMQAGDSAEGAVPARLGLVRGEGLPEGRRALRPGARAQSGSCRACALSTGSRCSSRATPRARRRRCAPRSRPRRTTTTPHSTSRRSWRTGSKPAEARPLAERAAAAAAALRGGAGTARGHERPGGRAGKRRGAAARRAPTAAVAARRPARAGRRAARGRTGARSGCRRCAAGRCCSPSAASPARSSATARRCSTRSTSATATASTFRIVYIREAHPQGEWQSTINTRQGVSLPRGEGARRSAPSTRRCAGSGSRSRTRRRSTRWTGPRRRRSSAFPSRAFVLDAAGKVTYSTALDEESLRAEALERALAAVAGEAAGRHGRP